MTETVATSRFAPRSAPPGFFDDRPWPCRTARFRALGHDFVVYSQSEQVADYLDGVLVDLAAPGAPAAAASRYYVLDRGERARNRRWALYFGAERLWLGGRLDSTVGTLLWHVNQETVRRTDPDMVLVHAAAAELAGVGVVLPAPMESGKTTTVAGLIRAGFNYLTDEAVAIDPASGRLAPFAKPLSVDRGSWRVLPDLEPALTLPKPTQWHVPASAIRAGSVATAVLPRLVIAPRYSRDAHTRLEPVARAQMLVMLAEATFHFHTHGTRNFGVLAELTRRCDCYQLTIGSLDEAVALVTELVRSTAAQEAS